MHSTPRPRAKPLMPLEILHRALVLFRGRSGFEGAEIAALAGFRIDLARIEPIFPGLQFADHGTMASFSAPLVSIATPPLAFHCCGLPIWQPSATSWI